MDLTKNLYKDKLQKVLVAAAAKVRAPTPNPTTSPLKVEGLSRSQSAPLKRSNPDNFSLLKPALPERKHLPSCSAFQLVIPFFNVWLVPEEIPPLNIPQLFDSQPRLRQRRNAGNLPSHPTNAPCGCS